MTSTSPNSAKDLGVEPEYTLVDPAARVDVLTSNKVDLVLANFTVTDEHKEKVELRQTVHEGGAWC